MDGVQIRDPDIDYDRTNSLARLLSQFRSTKLSCSHVIQKKELRNFVFLYQIV